MLRSILFACVGGAIGSGLRVFITTVVVSRFGLDFPYATMGINIAGSFFIGFVAELARQRAGFSPDLRLFLTAGILGGFTTFSAFSYDILNLWSTRAFALTLVYTIGSVVLGVVAAQGGISLIRSLAR